MRDEADKSQTTIPLQPPFEFALSDNVVGIYGFKDAHAELKIKLPFPLSKVKESYTIPCTIEQILEFRKGVKKALEFGKLDPEERKRAAPSEPFEFPIVDGVVGLYGFPDAHVGLRVKLKFPFSVAKKYYEDSFTFEELSKLDEGIDKAVLFSKVPPEERDRIGA